MDLVLQGIHHITAIAGDAQRNVDFYRGVLGLRLVKQTVNFDAPDVYHLYYGDGEARPGTILTFFPFPGAAPGRRGAGQVAATAFSIPDHALGYWTDRLASHGVLVEGPQDVHGEQVLSFADPDGLALELVAARDDSRPGWTSGPVPAAHAIRGFYGATLWVRDLAPSAALLTETMGFREVGRAAGRIRFATGDGGPGNWVDLLAVPRLERGTGGAGTIHHIAWRVPEDQQQLAWRQRLLAAGRQVTPVQDRQYFHSIYYHEPAGVLYEIATDPPGFAIDEAPDQLGTQLQLPPWLESRRPQLERALPPLHLPAFIPA